MKYYSDEFKNNIVKLYHNENRSKKSLANEYGVHPTTISHWIKRAKLVELPEKLFEVFERCLNFS